MRDYLPEGTKDLFSADDEESKRWVEAAIAGVKNQRQKTAGIVHSR